MKFIAVRQILDPKVHFYLNVETIQQISVADKYTETKIVIIDGGTCVYAGSAHDLIKELES